MYVCMYVCTHIRMHVDMYAYTYACRYICTHIRMPVDMYMGRVQGFVSKPPQMHVKKRMLLCEYKTLWEVLMLIAIMSAHM